MTAATLLLCAAMVAVGGWLFGALALGAASRWPRLVPPRALPALLVVLPLVASAGAAAVTLVPVDHHGDGPTCHHDGHGQLVAHASLGGQGVARALLPLTVPLALLLVWRTARRARLALAALRADAASPVSSRLVMDVAGRPVTVRLAPLGERNARAAAWPQPAVLFDEDWWAELSPSQRFIVVAHEAAHLRRRDPWLAAAACLASAVIPDAAWRGCFARWRAWAESAADLGAARAHGDPMDVAELIVEQQRRRVLARGPLLAFGDGCPISQRVHALAHATTPPGALDPDFGPGSMAAVLAAVALPLACAPVLHHAIELALFVPH